MRLIRGCVRLTFMLIFHLFYKVEKIDTDKFPKKGAYVLISNHIHWKDPLVYVCHSKRMIYAIGKEELFSTKLKAFIMSRLGVIPVNRNGKGGNQASILLAIRKVEAGNLLLIYPEGTRMGLYNNIKPKKGAALIALEAKVPIIPMAIVGSFKPFSTIRFKIGDPIDLSQYYPKEGEKVNARDLITVTNMAMDEVIKLRDSIQTDEIYKEMMQEEEKRLKLKESKAKWTY